MQLNLRLRLLSTCTKAFRSQSYIFLVKVLKMGANMFNLEKLVGRENFATWKFSMKTYLEHEDLWSCIERHDDKPVDASRDVKAKSKLILLLEPQNYVHVQECKTAKQVWENLQRAFDDNGLTRRVGLLRDLINTTLESSNSVEDYVSKIMNSAHKLRNICFEVNDEWLGTLMLAGLPEEYKPMIMGLESSGIQISADSVKSKLIQEVSTSKSAAFYTNSKKTRSNTQPVKSKGPRCFNCNKNGHFAKYCKQPKKQLANKGESSSFVAAFSATVEENISNKWFIDSGASMHMTSRNDWMYNVTEPPVKNITVANREPLAVKGVGSVDIHINQENKIQVKNVLFVPRLAANLLSVSSVVKNGYKVTFNNKGCEILNCKGEIICTATLNNNLYIMDTTHSKEVAHLTSSSVDCSNTYLWHLRMGHLNISDIKKLPACAEGVTLTQDKSNVTCTHCMEGRQTRLPFKNVGTRATRPLELIHSDLCGPMETLSFGGMKYFITFIDDFTRVVHVYFLKDKLNILETFKDFKLKVENELNHKIKNLRTDNGKEYCNYNFERFLSNHGIIHQTSIPYTPQHNGLAERMNRTLVERARCMLFYANLEKKFWAEALATAAYVVNRSPTKSLEGKTPYELWKGKKPNLSHIKIFGSVAMVHVPKEKRQKLDKKSVKMILVGYCESSKGYRLMHPKTHKIVKSRDVAFIENYNELVNVPMCETFDSFKDSQTATVSSFPPENVSMESTRASQKQKIHTQEPSSSVPMVSSKDSETQDGNNDEDSSEYDTDTGELDVTYHPSYPIRQDYNTNITLRSMRSQNKCNDAQNGLLCMFTNLTDPQTVEEALASPQATEWKRAMDEEYNSLIKNKTWTLAELPPGKKALPYKWVFKTKSDQNGNVLRYKARLVIKGYAQKGGTDYEEIYSPVVRYTTIRYLLALAARYGLEIDQMDAVSAFLQGDIDREIYMQQPEQYKHGSQVCKLHKSIYGLKQASRLWNLKLNDVLHELGMQQSKTDPCVYYNAEKNTFIAIWVDDLILFSAQEKSKMLLKENLREHFEIKDIGPANQCVGLHITRDGDKVMIDQEKYIKDILSRFRMSDCKPVKTPFEVSMKFNKIMEENNLTDCPYQQAIGSLLYVAQGTRPDISFAVNTLSRFNKNPTASHWAAVKRIFRYLQATKDLKLVYTKDGNDKITGYCDADWASDVCDRKSCTGYIFLLQGGAISWRSHKQQTVALSTAEAEYMSMSSAAQEALWLQQLHAELGQLQSTPLIIFSDNQSAIKLSNNDCYLPRSKHIDIRYHFLKDHVNNLKIKFCYVKGEEMIADNLTKGTTADKHLYCVTKMGLRPKGGC